MSKKYDEELLMVKLDELVEVIGRLAKGGLSPWRAHRLARMRSKAAELIRDWKLED